MFAFDNRTYVEAKGFSVTANLFTTRAVFDAVGGFDPSYAAYGNEDVDLYAEIEADIAARIAAAAVNV